MESNTEVRRGPVLVALRELNLEVENEQPYPGVSLDVRTGEILGLLGNERSGVGTMLDVLSGDALPDSGVLAIAGDSGAFDSPARLRRSGLVIRPPLRDELMPRSTVKETVALFASLYSRSPRRVHALTVTEALALAGLSEHAATRVAALAAADRALLSLAVAAATNAPLVLLSAPTAELDVEAARAFAARIGELRALGRTVVVASKSLDELAPLCDRVAVLDGGALVTVEEPAVLADRTRSRAAISFRLDSGVFGAAETAEFLRGVSTLAPPKIEELREGVSVTVYVEDSEVALRAVTFRRGLHARNVRAAGPTLADAAIFCAPIYSDAELRAEVR